MDVVQVDHIFTVHAEQRLNRVHLLDLAREHYRVRTLLGLRDKSKPSRHNDAAASLRII